MTRQMWHEIAFAIGVAMVCSVEARAIETTYGEDPVPNSRCYDGFLDLGYGIDPIPAKSLSVRWQEWRASHGLPPTTGLFKRQVGQSRFQNSPRTAEPLPPVISTPDASLPYEPRSSFRSGTGPLKPVQATSQRRR